MKTFTSIALLAAGATAQVIESASFGFGKTYETGPRLPVLVSNC